MESDDDSGGSASVADVDDQRARARASTTQLARHRLPRVRLSQHPPHSFVPAKEAEMNSAWSIAKAFGAWLTAASTLVVAVATIYLAFSARSSSESAREAAEAARESVDLTKRLFELSQRPLVTLDGDWEVNQVGGRVVEIRGGAARSGWCADDCRENLRVGWYPAECG